METESSVLQSKQSATCPCSEPDQSRPWPHPTFWRSILILSSHLILGLPCGLFPSGFPTKPLYACLLTPIRAMWPAHFIFLDFITQMILAEEYGSLSCSLYSLLHSPVTLSLLGPNIRLRSWGGGNKKSFFRRVHKIAKSFVMSVCPSLSPHGTTRLPLDGFSWNLYLSIFRKSVEEIKDSLKSDKNNGRVLYVKTDIHLWSYLAQFFSEKCFKQKL